MGKSYIATQIAQMAEEQDIRVWQYDYAAYGREDCCGRLVRHARDIARKISSGKDVQQGVVILDGVAPGDEGEVLREAKALRSLAHAGATIVICLRPEAEQLTEALPEARVLRADDLLFRTQDESNVVFGLTHGIPALVDAYRSDRLAQTVGGPRRERVGARFASALELLLAESLREGLCDEEYRLRLAMIALGTGTLDEIVALCGRCDYEQAMWLQRNVPLFGIDAGERTFECAAIDDLELFSSVSVSLQMALAREPELSVRVCSTLCARGDVRRSALLCKLCVSEFDISALGCRWGVSYLQAGELNLVASALSSASRLNVCEGNRAVLSDVALTCLRGTARDVEVAKERLHALCDGTAHEARLHAQVDVMVAERDLCRNPQLLAVRDLELARATGEAGAAAMTSDVSGIEHIRVLNMMFEGSFAAAYGELSNKVLLRRVDTLSEALLGMDLHVAVVLCGGSLDGSERWLIDEADAFFMRMPHGRLWRYHAAASALAEVLMGGSEGMTTLEDAVAQAERSGDVLVQAALLTAAAVGDLRTRTYSRARVRAMHAAKLAHTAGASYLASAAEFVCALTMVMLGENGSLESFCLCKGQPNDLRLLGSLAARAAGEVGHGVLFPDVPLGIPCPRDALWALNTIAYDCGGLSEEVRRLMPASWLELLKLARMRQAVAEEVAPHDDATDPATKGGGRVPSLADGGQAELLPFVGEGQRVRVKVLGGFDVWVDGEIVPDHRFERRRARDLVELLAIAPSHRLRRYQVVRALWPDEDYYRGPRKLYEATGEVRKLMGSRELGISAVVADRAQGAVCFDRAIVSCDIDDFESEARQTLVEDRDDFWVLDHARRMCRLYANGPDAHIESLGDEAAGRLIELESLFVEGLVAAGEAALRLGKARLAVRYATDAHRLRDLREDAVILLVQALRVAGRGVEVRDLYQRFSRHLMEAKGVLPSLALRQAVEHALSDVPEALSLDRDVAGG